MCGSLGGFGIFCVFEKGGIDTTDTSYELEEPLYDSGGISQDDQMVNVDKTGLLGGKKDRDVGRFNIHMNHMGLVEFGDPVRTVGEEFIESLFERTIISSIYTYKGVMMDQVGYGMIQEHEDIDSLKIEKEDGFDHHLITGFGDRLKKEGEGKERVIIGEG